MRVLDLHDWNVTPVEAVQIQRNMAALVSCANHVPSMPGYIAGADVSVTRSGSQATAAVVVLSWPGLEVVEVRTVRAKPGFPYIPGLLSFREVPLVLAAFKELALTPDLVLVDGQGRAHPRRFGLACHLGLFLDKPTIGCAKSVLCGTLKLVDSRAGSRAEIMDGDETIGSALRTREGVKPVYVSIGHKVDLPSALLWAMQCCRGRRIPEPLRLAHQAAGGAVIGQAR